MCKLTEKQLEDLKWIVMEELFSEMEDANEKGRIQEFICAKCSKQFCDKECAKYFVKPKQKVLIVGALRISKDNVYKIAENCFMDKENIEIKDVYKQLSHFDFDQLVNSSKYSDIIFAPIPHKTKGSHGSSGILAYIKNHESKYPHVIIAKAGGQMKLTTSSLTRALKETVMYQSLCAI